MEYGPRPMPPEFWTREAVVAALATCDVPMLMDEIRDQYGWTQAELAEAVGYSQSWVSKILRGKLPLTVSQVREIAEKLGIPTHLLRFGESGNEAPTNRREFTKTVALATLSAVPTTRPYETDETTAATLRAITGGHRRLDATTPAGDLCRSAVAHLEMAKRLALKARRSAFAPEVSAAASEAAGFVAWLHADMHDIGSARHYYREAIRNARNSDHVLLSAYMLGSLASFEIDGEDPHLGLALTTEARRMLGDPPEPTADAWLSSIEALGYATLPGDAARSDTAIHRAEHAIGRADPSSPPPWPWVFPFNYAKLSGYRALAAVRLGRTKQAKHAFAESVPVRSAAPKQRAVLMLELADMHTQAGDTDEGFRLATTALGIGRTYASERVIQHARRYRRRYHGPASKQIHDFDSQLRAALL